MYNGWTEDPEVTRKRFEEKCAKHERIMASSGNPESAAGKAIIADAKKVRDRLWSMQIEHTCYDTGLTQDVCHACEKEELEQDGELCF